MRLSLRAHLVRWPHAEPVVGTAVRLSVVIHVREIVERRNGTGGTYQAVVGEILEVSEVAE